MGYRAVATISAALIFGGCGLLTPPPPLVVTKEVKVPVFLPCKKPPVLAHHPLPVDALQPGDAQNNPGLVWEAMVETIQILQVEVKERDDVLAGY